MRCRQNNIRLLLALAVLLTPSYLRRANCVLSAFAADWCVAYVNVKYKVLVMDRVYISLLFWAELIPIAVYFRQAR